ncbi:type II secretion system F family protein [Pseudoneobacillus sp. C159]
MARFKYSGRNKKGKTSGTIQAESKREALQLLREEGVRVIEIDEVAESLLTKDLALGNPVRLQHLVIYLRQFATLLKAGVPVVDATRILSQQTDSKKLKTVLLDMEQELLEGNPLSAAAGKHPKVFSPMFINMVRAGEVGGNLDDTLERLAVHFEKQHHTKQKITSALAYPLTVGILAVGVVIFLLVKVVPTFVGMFQGFGAELPAITLFVLHASDWMQSFWWLVILWMIGIYFGIVILKNRKETRYFMDYFILRVPLFGKMMQKAMLARMTRTMSSLFASAVPILQAMAIVEKVVENEVIARVLRESREFVQKGESMTEPMTKHWAFPPMITQMIVIGEKTGALDEMLGKVADFYEKEVESSTDRLKSLIEPIMILVLAGLVGTIVLSIMIPMFDIFNHIQ